MTIGSDRRTQAAEAATVRIDTGEVSEPAMVDPTARALNDEAGERYETKGVQ